MTKNNAGQNPPRAAFIKIEDTKFAALRVLYQNGGYQVTTYDKENIDTDESTAEHRKASVIQDHWQDSGQPSIRPISDRYFINLPVSCSCGAMAIGNYFMKRGY